MRTHILHAVRDVSFELTRGSTLCLVGESGSGKSVTARALLRIVDQPGRMTGGAVLLHDSGRTTDIASLPANGRAMRAHPRAPHRAHFPGADEFAVPGPHDRLADHRSDPRAQEDVRAGGARRKRSSCCGRSRLPAPREMIDRYTFEFSGGMRQRAMIAMALSGDPDILIADEPTTALDVTTQAEILDLIKRLQAQPRHGDAADHARHGHRRRGGRRGRGHAVRPHRRAGKRWTIFFTAPRIPYTRQLLAATVRLEAGRAAAPARGGNGADPVGARTC